MFPPTAELLVSSELPCLPQLVCLFRNGSPKNTEKSKNRQKPQNPRKPATTKPFERKLQGFFTKAVFFTFTNLEFYNLTQRNIHSNFAVNL